MSTKEANSNALNFTELVVYQVIKLGWCTLCILVLIILWLQTLKYARRFGKTGAVDRYTLFTFFCLSISTMLEQLLQTFSILSHFAEFYNE
jgi:hypothetical protein